MAAVSGTKGRIEDRTRSSNHVVEEFVPLSGWTEDPEAHCLLIDLPDFKKEDIKLQVDLNSRQIRVSGERMVHHNKYIYFEKTFTLPENSDADKISGKFQDEMLYVTVPKQIIEEDKEETETEYENANGVMEDHEQEKPSNGENLNESNEEQHGDHGQQLIENKETSVRSSYIDGFRKEILRKWEGEITPLARAMKMLWKHKGLLLAGVLAFSLGVLVSRKFQSTGERGSDSIALSS